MKNFEYNQYLQQTKMYYDDKFGNSDFEQLNEEENERWSMINQVIKVELDNNESIRILDFGCGDGRFSKMLGKYGTVLGVDISDASISRAKNLMNSSDFYVCDLSSDELINYFREEEFDLIVTTEVLEHVYNQQAFFCNIYRLLKKDGVLILTTPNGKCFKHYFGNLSGKGGQPFEWWLSQKELNDALYKVGFREIKLRDFNFSWVLYKRKSLSLKLFFNRWLVSIIKKINGIQLVEKIVQRIGFGLYLIATSRK
jgi:2-polyprenyl-3-methyl-5-hydroxy-6-metoxy-1,4-benzoquinol methylase